MKITKQIPSYVALAVALGTFAGPLDPVRVLASLTFIGVAILLWPLSTSQQTAGGS